jgi:hypothetical protein
MVKSNFIESRFVASEKEYKNSQGIFELYNYPKFDENLFL